MNWERVTRREPCPICQKDHWCCVAGEIVLCMRVESAKPSKGEAGGWIHFLSDKQKGRIIRYEKKEKPILNVKEILSKFSSDGLPEVPGTTKSSLQALGAVWWGDKNAIAFPMFNEFGMPIGIRLRNDKGQKWAVEGSRQGIFLPVYAPSKTVYICEGPTDTAAMLTIGCYAIGRPSCMGAVEILSKTVKRLGIKQVVICADNDAPGIQGAEILSSALKLARTIFITPTKDVRDFVIQGGTFQLLDSMVKNLIWTT